MSGFWQADMKRILKIVKICGGADDDRTIEVDEYVELNKFVEISLYWSEIFQGGFGAIHLRR